MESLKKTGSDMSILAALGMLCPSREDRPTDFPPRHSIRYVCTKWSKGKRARLRKEERRQEKHLAECKKRKFVTSMAAIKTNIANQKWDYCCHIKERNKQKEHKRQELIDRLKTNLELHSLPSDSFIFEKLIKQRQEKIEKNIAQKNRMLNIINKVTRQIEMNKSQILDEGDSFKIIKTEQWRNLSQKGHHENVHSVLQDEEHITAVQDNIETMIRTTEKGFQVIQDNICMNTEKEECKAVEPCVEQTEKDNVPADLTLKGYKLSIDSHLVHRHKDKRYPKETCFYSNPTEIVFSNFVVGKAYVQKVVIYSRTVKWAYIRYNRIDTEIWETTTFEVQMPGAVRLKPGLKAMANVKFLPTNSEIITATISFLTLNSQHPQNYHEFRILVRCIPQGPKPVVEPKKLRFSTAPIWEFTDAKFNTKKILLSNVGEKAFSVLLMKQDKEFNTFVWDIPKEVMNSTKYSIKWVIANQKSIGAELPLPLEEYCIHIPPKFICPLRVTFHPHYIGVHHDVLEMHFRLGGLIFAKQKIPMWAIATGLPISLDPTFIDFGIVTVDSGVYQDNFEVINTSRTTVEVLLKTPRELDTQVTVDPKLTYIQTESSSTFSVRLMPKSTLMSTYSKYYDFASDAIKIPIQVQLVTCGGNNAPPLTLNVLATVTKCQALVLEPAQLNLGPVYTHEATVATLYLTNESFIIQEFGFFDLPASVQIQPGHGFGSILPGETVPLDLIYSPCSVEIPGNEIGANGCSGSHTFTIQAMTIVELAASKRHLKIEEMDPLYQRLSLLNDKPYVTSETEDEIQRVSVKGPKLEECVQFDVLSDSSSVAEDISIVSSDFNARDIEDARTRKNITEVSVFIIDALCEFSAQIIEFPVTPCGCLSTACVDLRGFNTASYPNCTCGVITQQRKKFTARYKLKCTSRRLEITPSDGILHSDEIEKITFVFKPKLPKYYVQKIYEEPKVEPKVTEKIKNEGKKKNGKKKGKRDSIKPPTPEEKPQEQVLSDDYIALWENLESKVLTIDVICTICLTMKGNDERKHDETLYLKLFCPVVKPDILILNAHRSIEFQPTALGTSISRNLFVKNISNRNVEVNATFLHSVTTFTLAPGRMLEAGSILILPVTYEPDEHLEYIKEHITVSAEGTRTQWGVTVSASAFVPNENSANIKKIL